MKTIVTRLALGYSMKLDLDDPEQRLAYETGHYEPETLKNCLAVLPSDGVALDIGAHVGFYTCAFGAAVGSSGGHVHSFEPVTANFTRLLENIELNRLSPHVHAFRLALGVAPGRLLLHQEPEGLTNNAVGANMLGPHDYLEIERAGWRSEEAPWKHSTIGPPSNT